MVSSSFPSNKTNVVPLCVVAVADFSRKKKKKEKRKKKKEKVSTLYVKIHEKG
jgi:hypothetical protein